MSQRKSPVVQHTLTGPRGPTSRGRGQRPVSKGKNLYIANPDTDSDSDEPQKPLAFGATSTPPQFGTRGLRTASGAGPREDSSGPQLQNQAQGNTAAMPGLAVGDTMMPQDWARQQQRQQIARGLTVITQPPTPGVGSPFGPEGSTSFENPIHAQYHYQPAPSHNNSSRNTGIPLSSSSVGDASVPREQQASAGNSGGGNLKGTNSSATRPAASPLSAVSGSGSGTGSAGTGAGVSSSASYDEGGSSLQLPERFPT